MNSHLESPTIVFGEGATFVRHCSKCNRFVRPYKRVKFDGYGQPKGPNAHCKKCGRVEMYFIGYF